MSKCGCHGRSIPDPIKRVIRRRCKFGCVICGIPIYEYHHMIPWHELRQQLKAQHDPHEITLLCNNCHRGAGSGLIPDADVRQADRVPFNSDRAVARSEVLRFSGEHYVWWLGGLRITSPLGRQGIPLMIDGRPIVQVEWDGGHMLFTADFYRDRRLLFQILRNEIRFRTDGWDVEFVGRRLTLRSGPRAVELEVEFNPPDSIKMHRGKFDCDGVEVRIHGGSVVCRRGSRTSKASDCDLTGLVGLSVGRHREGMPAALGISV